MKIVGGLLLSVFCVGSAFSSEMEPEAFVFERISDDILQNMAQTDLISKIKELQEERDEVLDAYNEMSRMYDNLQDKYAQSVDKHAQNIEAYRQREEENRQFLMGMIDEEQPNMPQTDLISRIKVLEDAYFELKDQKAEVENNLAIMERMYDEREEENRQFLMAYQKKNEEMFGKIVEEQPNMPQTDLISKIKELQDQKAEVENNLAIMERMYDERVEEYRQREEENRQFLMAYQKKNEEMFGKIVEEQPTEESV